MTAVIVTGDRHARRDIWYEVIRHQLHSWDVHLVIHGDAKGIDSLAGEIALDTPHMSSIAMSAQWNLYGNSAGPRRNQAMLDVLLILRGHGYDVSVLAFHDSIDTSKGTAGMMAMAEKANVPVRLVRSS